MQAMLLVPEHFEREIYVATTAILSSCTSLLQAVKFCFFWEGLGRKIQTLGRELITAPFLGEKFFSRLKDNVFLLSLFIFYLEKEI